VTFVTLNAFCRLPSGNRSREVEMPAVTTGLYAAGRVAKAMGLDPELPWCLAGLKADESVGPLMEPGARYELFLGDV